MTIEELRAALDRVVAADPHAKNMQVRFGPQMHPINGGIVTKDVSKLVVLSLAPIKLDQVGGI